MKKIYILIGILMIVLGGVGIFYNNILFKNPKSVFSTEVFPVDEVSQFYVDDGLRLVF